jgi:hypothetical protein
MLIFMRKFGSRALSSMFMVPRNDDIDREHGARQTSAPLSHLQYQCEFVMCFQSILNSQDFTHRHGGTVLGVLQLPGLTRAPARLPKSGLGGH